MAVARPHGSGFNVCDQTGTGLDQSIASPSSLIIVLTTLRSSATSSLAQTAAHSFLLRLYSGHDDWQFGGRGANRLTPNVTSCLAPGPRDGEGLRSDLMCLGAELVGGVV